MTGLFEVIMMYGASVWGDLLIYGYAREEVLRCQRLVLYACLRVCRMVSTAAMQVLAGSPPWDLLCRKRRTQYRVKRELIMDGLDWITEEERAENGLLEIESMCNERMLSEWQRRWDQEGREKVTYKFIREVEFMGKCKRLDFSLRAGFILTGHGSLNEWLHARGLSDSPACGCGQANESWLHLLCECIMYEEFRDLEGMGVIVGEGIDGVIAYEFAGVVMSEKSYGKFERFIERAYRMRSRVGG